jgi:hypothetical protein
MEGTFPTATIVEVQLVGNRDSTKPRCSPIISMASYQDPAWWTTSTNKEHDSENLERFFQLVVLHSTMQLQPSCR